MVTPIEVVQAVLGDAVQCDVVTKVPVNRPELFVRVDQSAPQVLSPIHQRAQVFVQVYGPTSEAALDMAFRVRERLMDASSIHPKCFGVDEITGPSELPDPDIQHVARWQVTGIVYMAIG